MINRPNNNIGVNSLKAIADFWSSAAKYQIFVILAAIALLVVLPLFGAQQSNAANTVINIAIFCAAAAGCFFLFKSKGLHLASFTFATALLFRLCLIFILETSTPFMLENIRTRTGPWIRHYDTMLFQADEFLYIYEGQRYGNTKFSEFMHSPEISNHTHRASFLLSRLFRFFGEQFLWPRVIGALLGAFSATIICLVAQNLFKKETSIIVSLLAALAPQTAFYSVRFLKENWVIFAAGLMIFGFAAIIRNKRPLWAIFSIMVSAIILFWVRFEYGLIFLAAIPIVISFRRKSSFVGKMIAIAPIIFLGTIILFCQLNQLTQKAGNMIDKYILMERGQRGKLEAVGVLDKIYQSRGTLRLLNIPLSMLNPPPKNLHHIYTKENKIYDIVLLANIYQWWLPLPFLIIGAILITIKRTELSALLLSYLVAICISAILIGGLEPNLLRYRDSLAPVAFIIIGAGIEGFLASQENWKNWIIGAVYAAFIICAIFILPIIYFNVRNF
ncbi:MAG: hypothetical protein PHQ00_00305 [Phycisphaerae bacterium]|nr:hypothetical protein [Phycisphaerae bacterium]